MNDPLLALLSLPQSGIWALEHTESKRIFISFSRDMASGVSTTARLLRIKSHRVDSLNKDPSKYTFKLLEACDESELRLRHYYWCSHYENLGYLVLNEHKGLSLRFRLLPGPKYTWMVKMVYNVNTAVILALYATKEEAMEHILKIKTMDIPMPVYGSNELTLEYLKKNKKG
jgi:hypothetical protein